jgi:hypothetical protein
MPRHLVADRNMEILLGLAALALGALLLRDAYEGRGRSQPALMRPFSWW